ncbi:cache domain-containing protein [Hydrogenispora ethanolica]|uniref:Cache domain-containing protein n=1 Tax=Hydrogenispora ethanolica TaxID=1082276 RepID=A0A4R1RQI1_HYDET|nr:helix-turn-helix domain-containing protein [Hydrogenispora ethanolica]TCL68566.1 cache domain-containing protein [Hydrogenispora ethanolica]
MELDSLNQKLSRMTKLNSLFGKLILSFIIVVMIVTFIVGIFSYLFFSSRFNHEIETVHQKVLEQVAETLKFQIIEPVILCFMDLSTEYDGSSETLFHFNEPVKGNHYQLYQTYNYFQKIVANHPGIISAIHVYYKKQDLIISSSSGVSYLTHQGQSYKKLDWLRAMNHYPDSFRWIESRKVLRDIAPETMDRKTNYFTFVRTFPMISSGTDYQGVIAIDVAESTVSRIIQKIIPAEYQHTFIINQRGQIISHPRKKLLYQSLNQEKYVRRILASRRNYDSFGGKVGRVASMIAFASLPYSDWKIVNITPIHRFYQSTIFVQQLLMVICLLAIGIGLAASFILTRRIYNPLAVIIQKVRALTGSKDPNLAAENEYGFINHFIDEMAVKVTSLQANEPVIRNHFITGLLYNRFLTAQEFAKELDLFHANLDYPYFCVVLIQVDHQVFKNFTFEESQTIKERLIRASEANNSPALYHVGVGLADQRIALIIGSTRPDPEHLENLAGKITDFLWADYRLPVSITAGTWTDSLLGIHRSFQEAAVLFKYCYFYPDIPVLTGEAFLPKEASPESLPDSFIQEFAANLKTGNLKQVDAVLAGLVERIRQGHYSADHCRQKLLEITRIFSIYIKEMQYKLSEKEISGLQDLFSENNNIAGFAFWITGCAERVFQWNQTRISNRNYQIVAEALAYIAEHLSAADLSLDSVAEHIRLSPGYFSKIFKEVTGVAFITYINDQRLEKARGLLLQTALSVQEVGFQAGYNAAAYFIKQFKARYGYTPYDYRRQFQPRSQTVPES